MERWVRGTLAAAILGLLCTCAAPAQTMRQFPYPDNFIQVPKDTHELAKHERLLKAIYSKLGDPSVTSKERDRTTVVATYVKLGKLGDAAIVTRLGGLSVCTPSGNCEIYVFYDHMGRIIVNQLSDGWAYAIVQAGKIPDIVVEANTTENSGVARRFSFVKNRFEQWGCDEVTLKKDDVANRHAAILDPEQVDVKACAAQ